MRLSLTLLTSCAVALLFLVSSEASCQTPAYQPRLAIHGGAGTILKKNMTPERETAYREKLTEALNTGYALLLKGGSSLDAVEATIRVMEDSPLFNAGKGAVFTHEGTNELDAAIMEGKTLKAGAVAVLKHVRNPITLARRVMERSPHVLMVGEGAEAFAAQVGVELVDPSYFRTEQRWKQLQDELQKEHDSTKEDKHGTVGCVALDRDGNLAAGTSTGGMTNKKYGRIGDAPIIGAGTYANNATCAVSATGTGEYFIRGVVAHDISALMEYGGRSLAEAADLVVHKKLPALGGPDTGGVIALDRSGNIAMPFNTPGMYRGYVDRDGRPVVEIYADSAAVK
jgi:beta-aspartyl-peptidase (threonine type)